MTRLDDVATGRPSADDPEGSGPGSAQRSPASPRVRPAHVASAIVFAGAVWIAATPINDLDSYWHVQIGQEILARHTFVGLGQQWRGVPRYPWRTPTE